MKHALDSKPTGARAHLDVLIADAEEALADRRKELEPAIAAGRLAFDELHDREHDLDMLKRAVHSLDQLRGPRIKSEEGAAS